ncbi:heterokaryon incompatibility protein-domain-containing protein [Colletotrichum navitas]|uniref:Heterokaryon incompatibility protein-domain-containing protein n=1 Tax=Colletotrichum navitas TaxID=681940 RepID=A0AAD8QAW5_9PEZI|nr:heterokaryon incompatibility protein-domain-containing protein [Colletotrichum navitas]KAK1599288.1 heterokaryon incompatibility protein-domain-containing protein [Colletotrichum navitas]
MLCGDCQRVFEQKAEHGHGGRWFAESNWSTSLAAIQAHGATCVACHAVMRGLREADLELEDDRPLSLRGILFSPGTHDGLFESMPYATFDVSDAASQKHLYCPCILLEQVDGQEKQSLFAPVESTSTGSLGTQRFITSCLEHCLANHEVCRASRAQEAWFPTRLIEIEGPNARLIVTKETPPKGPYISLSHCWGGADIIKCTEKTLPELRKGVRASDLPATFRDALSATRSLGLAYIWIDSLCIVQDSPSDWAAESKTMLNVYQHSILNLAATQSRNSHTGLFVHRTPGSLLSGPFPISNGALSGSFIAVEAALDEPYWTAAVDNAPLNTRGWVLQERVISPRVAHFTSDQVIWDCAELTAAETVPSGAQAMPRMVPLGIGPKRGSSLLKVPPEQDRALGQWGTIVKAYSQCHLTVPSDKVVALSGVVDYLRLKLRDKFYAGLWRAQMEMQLCWIVVGSSAAKRNASAPSWSWMSVDCAVDTPQHHQYDRYVVRLLAKVVDVDETAETDNKGSIWLRGVLSPVTLEAQPQPRLIGPGMEHLVDLSLDTADAVDAAGALFFVPVFDVQGPDTGVMHQRFSELRGLLLEELDKEAGRYLRRGHVFASARPDMNSKQFPESCLAFLQAVEQNLPRSSEGNTTTSRLISIT